VLLQAKVSQTNNSMDQIEAALVLFAIRNSRLPCPADGSLTNTSAGYGSEVTQSNAGTPTGQCNMAAFNAAATTTNSVIPWRSLGLDETFSVDGWGNRISYYPANAMLGATIGNLVDNVTTAGGTQSYCLSRISQQSQTTNRSAAVCDVANEPVAPTVTTGGTYGTYTVATYPFNNYIAVYATTATGCGAELTQPNTDNSNAAYSGADTCTGVTAQVTATNSNVMYDGLRAAYVLISHGPSGFYAWNKAGGKQFLPSSVSTIKAYNSGVVANLAGTAPNLGFVQGSFKNLNYRSSTDYFDDIVRWRSPAYIIQNCGGSACGNP